MNHLPRIVRIIARTKEEFEREAEIMRKIYDCPVVWLRYEMMPGSDVTR